MQISKKHKELVEMFFNLLSQAGITAYQVYKKTNLNQSYLSKVKSGKLQLSMTALMKICEAYKIDVDFYFKGKKNKIILEIISSSIYNSFINILKGLFYDLYLPIPSEA